MGQTFPEQGTGDFIEPSEGKWFAQHEDPIAGDYRLRGFGWTGKGCSPENVLRCIRRRIPLQWWFGIWIDTGAIIALIDHGKTGSAAQLDMANRKKLNTATIQFNVRRLDI